MIKPTTDQIDNYHAGRMSESEMADFENTVNSDPTTKAESDFQADIVSGIKEYRKIELKGRLDAINVSPTWFEFAQQSTLMKSLGGVMIASLIGTGIFIYGERPEKETKNSLATVEAQKVESIEFVWELGAENENVALDLQAEQSNPTERINGENLIEESKKIKEPTEDEVKVVKEEVFKPSFEAPDAESVEDEQFETAVLDEITSGVAKSETEEPIDVKSESAKNKSIKYKYYDGKLFLKGDFDRAPYEILEINSAEGRRIYVYYLDKYYKVNIADKLTDLPEVTNVQTIEELKLLRNNK